MNSTCKANMPFSIWCTRGEFKFVNSNQLQRGKTFDEHYGLDETREELLTVKRLAAVWDHPPSARRQLFRNRSAGIRRQRRAVILNEV